MFDPSKKHYHWAGGPRIELLQIYRPRPGEPREVFEGHAHCVDCGIWIDTEDTHCRRCSNDSEPP